MSWLSSPSIEQIVERGLVHRVVRSVAEPHEDGVASQGEMSGELVPAADGVPGTGLARRALDERPRGPGADGARDEGGRRRSPEHVGHAEPADTDRVDP